MGLLDLILNVTGVLLWINWRSLCLAASTRSTPLSLVSTLKRPQPKRGARWIPLGALLALLVLRSYVYWKLGAATRWTPNLELVVISLPFRSDFLWRSFLFSILSFGLLLAAFYAWLLLISVVNRKVPGDDPIQRLVRLHLGWVDRWPTPVKLLLPLILSTGLWALASPAFARIGMIPSQTSSQHVWQQAFLIGLGSYLLWKLLILGLCLLYLVNSYVYLGKSHFWQFVNMTGSNLLRPLRRFPLLMGKVDLSPLCGIALTLAVSQALNQWLPRLYQRLAG